MTTLARLAVALLIGTLLTSCATAEATPTCDAAPGLVFITAVHQNTQAPSVPATLACTLEATITAGHPIVVIGVDGTPAPLLASTFEVTAANPDARRDDIAAAASYVVGTINAAAADSDGADLLAAIAMGADQARALGATTAHLVVIDSGLPDRGALDMTRPGMLAADPAEVATFLQANGSMPDLAGFTIELVSFGYVTTPQQPLSIAAYNNMLAIWTTVLESAGATVTLTPLARTGEGPDTVHTTRTAPVPADPTPHTDPTLPPTEAVYDDTTALGFQPDSTELRDPTAATNELTPLAQWLAADPTRSVHILGTTASAGTQDGRAQLSLARANTIKTLLMTAPHGANPDQITTEGAGYTANPPDRTPTGDLDPAAAALNRTVRLTTNG